jgi:hypothetical protein
MCINPKGTVNCSIAYGLQRKVCAECYVTLYELTVIEDQFSTLMEDSNSFESDMAHTFNGLMTKCNKGEIDDDTTNTNGSNSDTSTDT